MNRRAAAAALVLAAVVLTGCASPDTPPPNGVETLAASDVLSRSRAAADAQASLRVVTKGSRDGLPFLVDMRLRRGGGAAGSVTLGTQRIAVLSDGSSVYVNAPPAYWRSVMDPAYATAIGTMWVKAPQGAEALASFAALTDYSGLMGSFLSGAAPATRGDVSRVVDRKAVQVVSGQGSVWIAVDGAPLPVQADSPQTGDVVRFGEWGSPVEISIPSDADTVDLGQLGAR